MIVEKKVIFNLKALQDQIQKSQQLSNEILTNFKSSGCK